MKLRRARPASVMLFLFLCLFLTFLFPLCSSAEDATKEKILTDVTEDIRLEGTDFNFYEKAEAVLNGEAIVGSERVVFSIFNMFFSMLKENFHLLTKIAALCIFSGVLGAITGEDTSQLGFLVCLVLITSMAINVLKNVLLSAETTIDNLLIFMQSLIPSVSMLSAGAENAFSISFHPALFAAMQTVIYTCKHWFLPMILFVSVLSVINSMTARFHITKLLETCRLFIKWGLGLLMTIYVALLGIQGFSGAMQAGALSKTAKYAIGTFIPMVGSVLAESAESVLASIYLIRNAVGIAGMIAILSLTASPILNILSTSVIFRLAASLSEPVADKRITKLISDLAGSVSLIFSILLAVSAMFMISIAMLLSITNIPQMMR